MLLRIKSNWQIFPVDARGVDFLGYVFYHTHTKIRKKVKQNIKKKVVSCAKKGMSAKRDTQSRWKLPRLVELWKYEKSYTQTKYNRKWKKYSSKVPTAF